MAAFQSTVSTQPHPLLRAESLSVQPTADPPPVEEINSSDDALVDAFGTLAIGESGESKYFGRSGGSEVCLSSLTPV